MDERDRSPEGRFKYLAEKRTEKALKAIQSVAVLRDRKNYKYNKDQVDQIVTALEESVENLKISFSESLREPKAFKLKG